MKKYNILSNITSFAVFISVFALSSCTKGYNVDTTAPTIELDEPEDGDELLIGAGIHFECDFRDDVMLGSYMIEIHNNFDGHSHKAKSRAVNEEPLFFKKSYDLTGLRNSHVHHHDVVIPENAQEGNYHLVVYCTDAAGNQSLVAREIILSHDAEENHHHEDDCEEN